MYTYKEFAGRDDRGDSGESRDDELLRICCVTQAESFSLSGSQCPSLSRDDPLSPKGAWTRARSLSPSDPTPLRDSLVLASGHSSQGLPQAWGHKELAMTKQLSLYTIIDVNTVVERRVMIRL